MKGTGTGTGEATRAGGDGAGDGAGEGAGGRGGDADRTHWRIVVADRVSPEGLAPLLEDDRFEVVRLEGSIDLSRTTAVTDEAVGAEGAGAAGSGVASSGTASSGTAGSGIAGSGSDPDGPGALAEAHGLIVRSATQVTAELLDAAPQLRVVGRAGVGVDNIDLEAATGRGVAVLNAPAGNTVSAAEHTMALLLSLARRIPAADRSVREGSWQRSRFAGTELRGKVLGLLGAGRIGGEVARRARAFGMDVVVHDPWLTDERARDLGVDRLEDVEALLARADVVSLHVPLTDQTRHLLADARLRRMKPGALLVNASRGGIVDEDALAAALEAGRLGGAAVDVFDEEPLPADSPLRRAPNTVLTPHLGASTAEAQERVAAEIAGAVRAALADGDLGRALNAPSVGGEALRRLSSLFDLGRRIGRLAAGLPHGGTRGMEVRYAGSHEDALDPLAVHVVVGFLSVVLGEEQVNLVNARHLAEGRGIGLSRHRLARRTDYTEFVEVLVRTERGRMRLAGALLEERHPRLVRIDDYHVDVTPRRTLIVLRNRDVPGVIGRVGSLLGSAGLNIAEYHQSRLEEGGQALATVAVDGDVPGDVLTALRRLQEITDARVVELP